MGALPVSDISGQIKIHKLLIITVHKLLAASPVIIICSDTPRIKHRSSGHSGKNLPTFDRFNLTWCQVGRNCHQEGTNAASEKRVVVTNVADGIIAVPRCAYDFTTIGEAQFPSNKVISGVV